MSFNRRRNIFTLGDFHLQHPHQHPVKAQLSRRQNFDPFERDPFKIQSYNFHYADRPTYPVLNIGSRASKQNAPASKPFETHFYNHDFSTARHDKENSSTNKFHEFRRRKFLHNNQQASSAQQRNAQHQQQHQSQESEEYHEQQRRNQHRPTTSTAAATAGPTRIPLLRTATRATTAPTASFLRNGTNRECLQGLRSFYSSNPSDTSNIQMRQQQQGCFQRSNTFTRSSSSRVSMADSATGLPGMRRLQKANTFISSHNNSNSNTNLNLNTTYKILPNRGQSNRNPTQTIHVPAQNLVLKDSQSSSGCQINIRIKGLDDKTLGENVTIKIESDSSSNSNKTTNIQPHKPQMPISPNNLTTKLDTSEQLKNVESSNSSDTICINKRLSKFSLSERSSTLDQIKPHCVEINPLKSLKVEAKERVPSRVPWVLNNNYGHHSFGSTENNAESPIAPTAHSSLLRRICNNYNAGLDDIKNLRDKVKGRIPTTSIVSSLKPMNAKLSGEHKLLNTITGVRKTEPLMSQTQKCGLKQQGSYLSLRNNMQKRNTTSPDNTLTTSISSTSQFQRTTSPMVYQTTRRSLSPLNVNINVYADKLKLLRV